MTLANRGKSFLKSTSIRILFFIFIANFFYDDPSLYLYKRIIYSIFIYIASWELGKFYLEVNKNNFKMPIFFRVYLPLIFLSIIIGLVMDLNNPRLSWVTLINHPHALLTVTPIFIFALGVYTDDKELDIFFVLLLIMSAAFILTFALPFFGKVKYYQGYICANAFIPLLILSIIKKKYQFLAVTLMIVSVYFSQISGYRIIFLRLILFSSLLISLVVVQKWGILKFIIIAFTCFCMYQFLANLEDLLYLFKGIIGVKDFDDDDTRGFLYEELFGDMKSHELIFGRGYLGTYFSEYFLMLIVRLHTYGDHFERFGVEVGFLHLILKGGYYYYILYVLPILYAIIKGIFVDYTNKLIFYLSIYLLTEYLLMFIENIPYFSIQFSFIFYLSGYVIQRIHFDNLDKKNIKLST